MNEEQLEQRFEELHKLSRDYAQAAADKAHIEEYRKVRKAELMKQAERDGITTVAKQERDAYASPEYAELLDNLRTAIFEETRLKWELELFKIKFEAWRTLRADNRARANLV